MNRIIRKVAVLGSGVMGSRIACHFANVGLEVLLLDIVDSKFEASTKKAERNSIVDAALKAALKSNPSPIYNQKFTSRITTGNFTDDMSKINTCDWIIEAVVERLDIKQQVFEQVEKHRKPGTLITTNTSGIPIKMLLEGRSDDFQSHFLGTHFFNPPRYLKLFEIIPSDKTKPEIVSFFQGFSKRILGKTPVLCKDTPAFIANRIGVYGMMSIFHLLVEMDMKIEDIDNLTGTLIGRPKSASFRTGDVVGLDTLIKVAEGVQKNCLNDEQNAQFAIPDYVNFLQENKFLGDKSGQGFYKKTKNDAGKTEILVFDPKSKDYRTQDKTKFASIGKAKSIEDLKSRLIMLHDDSDLGTQFIKKLNLNLFAYVQHRIPEIADAIYLIDDAMKAGFGWEVGPFELWDILGFEKIYTQLKDQNTPIASWIEEMKSNGITSFYKIENNSRSYYDIASKSYQNLPDSQDIIALDILRGEKTIWKNSGCSIIDLGDGIINVEFRTKMNAIGGEILEGLNKAIDMAEKDYRGIVLGNNAANFSAGANLAMIYMLALEQEFEELNMVIKMFQNAVMRLRYSGIPVIGAPHGLTLGGGCELMMHCDGVVAAAETYIGLVEVGVGLIPGGGGTKEFALRVSDLTKESDPTLPVLADRFTTIATAKTATSAHEAFDIGYLKTDKDIVCTNLDRQIYLAKQMAIQKSDAYVQPVQRQDILVQGKSGLAALYAGVAGFEIGGYASEHDKKIAQKIAWVLCGGDLSQPSLVSEQYLLDLEREAFLSLLGERKTLERIKSILTSGKPLRN
ncbi:MAG: 3-hydroxyacyl-CoA dehydrogenase/enoyl-CoA hydratase family protein [Chitinophagales bacterium]|jgi:3-hydroxyacyl-CoA dehydrogenase|nr:3-hydroxyacyl-CoA dehydrogenase/enoyl-CoA hydratase family protein [Chitinophagales bacterium]